MDDGIPQYVHDKAKAFRDSWEQGEKKKLRLPGIQQSYIQGYLDALHDINGAGNVFVPPEEPESPEPDDTGTAQ